MKGSFNFGQELRQVGEGVLGHFDKNYYELVRGTLTISQELLQISKGVLRHFYKNYCKLVEGSLGIPIGVIGSLDISTRMIINSSKSPEAFL